MNRKRESQIRLEALGGRSDYYDVVSVSGRSNTSQAIDSDDDWDVDSTSSKASTIAVVSDKPPPPGYHLQTKHRQLSNADIPRDSIGLAMSSHKRIEPENSYLASRLQQARAEQAPTKAFTESESLNHSRHPSIMRPASALPSKAKSEYGGSSSSTYKRSSWAPKTPAYVASMPDWESRSSYGGAISRPASTYSAYQPPTPRALPSRPPSTNLYGAPMRDDDDDLRSDYSTATYSHAPRTANPLSRSGVQSSRVYELSELNNRRYSFSHTTTPTAAPTPTPRAPRPAVEPIHIPPRGRRMSHHHTSTPQTPQHQQQHQQPPPSPKRSPSPSRGAWHSDAPRQKRASFVDRAREHFEKSVHTHLVKAGQRPRPSFEVRSVCRSPVEDVVSAAQLPFAMRWRRRQEAAGESVPSVPGVAVAELPAEGNGSGRVEAEVDDPARLSAPRAPVQKKSDELFGAAPNNRASGLFEPKWMGANGPERKPTPELRINTDVPPVSAARPLRTAPLCPGDSSNASAVSSAGSLFLPRKAMRSPADYSFFAPEWTQRQHQRGPPTPAARPQTAFEPDYSARPAFSKEQLGVAMLPAGADFSVLPDDRRTLPSQQHHQVPNQMPGPMPNHRGLARKKGNRFLR
ncbi:hypothetical protein F5B20DRAFT_592152 [Whalleya microplaca]|nr:hypothetical protein F5B20DRAFT_592152 [Whalleya microplaca]